MVMTVIADAEQEMNVAAAHRVLGLLQRRRAVADGYAAGMSQTQIASRIGISQAEVSRTVALVRHHPEMLEDTPTIWIAEYVLSQLNRSELVERLARFPYTFANHGGSSSWPERVSGSWDDVETAHVFGQIDDDLFARVCHRVQPEQQDKREPGNAATATYDSDV